jgi:hypothetical protein
MKVKNSLKDAAKKNNVCLSACFLLLLFFFFSFFFFFFFFSFPVQLDVCKVLAKSLVESRKAKNRIHASKAQMNSVTMNMQNQLSAFAAACCSMSFSFSLTKFVQA